MFHGKNIKDNLVQIGDVVEIYNDKTGFISTGTVVEECGNALNDLACYRVKHWAGSSLFYIKSQLGSPKYLNADDNSTWMAKQGNVQKPHPSSPWIIRQSIYALNSASQHVVWYRLTKESAIPNWSDTEEALGRWYRSLIFFDFDDSQWRDYNYPSALQSNGKMMICGRVARSFDAMKLFVPIETKAFSGVFQ
jgi:hypothetical protein